MYLIFPAEIQCFLSEVWICICGASQLDCKYTNHSVTEVVPYIYYCRISSTYVHSGTLEIHCWEFIAKKATHLFGIEFIWSVAIIAMLSDNYQGHEEGKSSPMHQI